MILLDSNVWVYFLDAEMKEHAKVRKWLPSALEDEDVLIPTIVQMEVLHYLVKQLGGNAGDAVDAFLAHPADVAPLTGSIVAEAARLLLVQRAEGIGGRDAALLVIAKRTGATLATADKALGRVARKVKVTVVDPTR